MSCTGRKPWGDHHGRPLGPEDHLRGSGITELANLNGWRLEAFIASFEELNQNFDFVILDTGAGVHRTVTSFVLAATDILVVTTRNQPRSRMPTDS